MTGGAESAGFGASADLPPLPPLPQYTCGACGEAHGSNCDPDDIVCPYCEARRCPHCLKWFGAEFGEDAVITMQPGSDQVTVSRSQLADALTRLDVRVLTSGPAAGMINAESMADAILEALAS